MSEFDGLRNHEKAQHALVGLGSAAVVVAVVLPRQGDPNFPKGIIKRIKKKSIPHWQQVSKLLALPPKWGTADAGIKVIPGGGAQGLSKVHSFLFESGVYQNTLSCFVCCQDAFHPHRPLVFFCLPGLFNFQGHIPQTSPKVKLVCH